ncbi:MAG TPA: hypothetical protein VF815_21620 [Myxococcaceae bacterium]
MTRYIPPRPKPQLRDRGVALVEINGKERPAIIVRIFKEEERALVVYGTGTRRTELLVVEVPEVSAAGRALKLTKPTCFYGNAVRSVKLSHLKPSEGHCVPELFLQIRALAEGAVGVLPASVLVEDLADGAAPPLNTQEESDP